MKFVKKFGNKFVKRRNNGNTQMAPWNIFVMQTNVILIFVSTFVNNTYTLYFRSLFN